MKIDIRNNLADVERGLSDFARKQLPFAASLAINRALTDVQDNSVKRLRRVIDRPTPFTLRAFVIKRASKGRLSGSVFARPVQRDYLRLLETGGTREPDGKAILVPGKIRLNKFGNIPRKGTARAAGRAGAFVGKAGRRDRAGVWQRIGKGRGRSLRLLVGFEDKARYAPRLGFGDVAQKTAQARLPKHLGDALARAIKTARRGN